MKKRGILNSEIAKIVDDLRHTDRIIIGDCGLPVPENVKQIDISLKQGTPSFYSVLELILEEVAVEKAVLATEIKENNVELHGQLKELLPEIEYVSHDEFKQLSKEVKAVIRTGEDTPYANVILQSAVIF
ncbi:D-ribose pyranase [Enterococcus ureilyticus]|uniref:D-ribose pyranase n=1 Tax=Enterococcus ureilyticus TaxID=1131292 RepID=A0A1E5H8W8_9ENTE|nr:D-ribose pyranase [Enterococcus ureilyticus]MBM7687521.1 D-ribose pyranase [Enterococcus ureilyticus]OEG21354.1 D-ribose pyranase [Enterococcus ureilyticus]